MKTQMQTKPSRLRLSALLTAAALIFCASLPVLAQSSPVTVKDFAKNAYPGATVCFSEEDITENTLSPRFPSELMVAGLPMAEVGTLTLEDKVLAEGSLIPCKSLDELCFKPATSAEFSAEISLVPITSRSVHDLGGHPFTVTLNFSKDPNSPPIAQSSSLETYRNMPVYVDLSAHDHDGDGLTFSVVSCGTKGTLELSGERLIFTPQKDALGTAEIVFFARDSAGNTSKPASVTVEIKRQRSDFSYCDVSDPCLEYSAVRMAESGIFVGEQFGTLNVLANEKGFSRTEFTAICASALGLEADPNSALSVSGIEPWQWGFVPTAMAASLFDGGELTSPVTGDSAAYIAWTLLSETAPEDHGALTELYGKWLGKDRLSREEALEMIYFTAKTAGEND